MANDNGMVETNPMRRVHKLREEPAREPYLTDEEERRLFAVLVGKARSHPPDRRRGFANWNATARNPGLEMGTRGLRSEIDLRSSHQDGKTTKNSDEQAC